MSETPSDPEYGKAVQWDTVFESEIEYLGYGAADAASKSDPNLTGLCLSGGGVRSAIFCSGVLEYLARKDLLRKFDYISTVSGGGYAGSALSYWSYKEEQRSDSGISALLPFLSKGASRSDNETEVEATVEMVNPFEYHTAFLRHMSVGISRLLTSGIGAKIQISYVIVRSIIINAIISIGLLTGLFGLLFNDGLGGVIHFDLAGLTSAALFPGLGSFEVSRSKYLFLAFSGLGLLSAVFWFLLIPIFSIGSYVKLGTGYIWRKTIHRAAGFLFLIAIIFTLLGFLPFATDTSRPPFSWFAQLYKQLEDSITTGGIGIVVGAAITLYLRYRDEVDQFLGNTLKPLLVIFGAIILIVYTALVSLHLAQSLDGNAIPLLFAGSLLLAVICNINDVSLWQFYRDQLMETFMPDKENIALAGKDRRPLTQFGWARQADKVRLTDLRTVIKPIERRHPGLHLVNTTLLPWWAPDTKTQLRKGDNFILSPLFCGSDMTQWKRTEDVAKNRLTLADAMAASGTPINPKVGFAGLGPTQSWPVAMAKSFLGLRLGYWLRWTKHPNISPFGNYIHPGLTYLVKRLFSPEVRGTVSSDLIGKPHEVSPGFLSLSDGGYFDELGLYELIRRKCRLVLICDGSHDPLQAHEAFASLVPHIAEDFGAEIRFDIEFDEKWTRRDGIDSQTWLKRFSGPQDLSASKIEDEYPSGAEYAKKGYFLASVTYRENPQQPREDGYRACRNQTFEKSEYPPRGLLIFLRPQMIREVGITTRFYRQKHPSFLYDTKSNDYYSPKQFAAFRDLGMTIASQMDRELVLSNLIDELTKDNDLSGFTARHHGQEQFRK